MPDSRDPRLDLARLRFGCFEKVLFEDMLGEGFLNFFLISKEVTGSSPPPSCL